MTPTAAVMISGIDNKIIITIITTMQNAKFSLSPLKNIVSEL